MKAFKMIFWIALLFMVVFAVIASYFAYDPKNAANFTNIVGQWVAIIAVLIGLYFTFLQARKEENVVEELYCEPELNHICTMKVKGVISPAQQTRNIENNPVQRAFDSMKTNYYFNNPPVNSAKRLRNTQNLKIMKVTCKHGIDENKECARRDGKNCLAWELPDEEEINKPQAT